MDNKEKEIQDLKQVAPTEQSEINHNDEPAEQIFFASAPPKTKAKPTSNNTRISLQQDDEGDSDEIVLATSNEKPITPPLPKKSNKRTAIVITSSVAAIACIATVAVAVATQNISRGHADIPVAADVSATSSVNGGVYQTSTGSAESKVISQSGVQASSAEQLIKEVKTQPVEITDVNTKDIKFGKNVTVEGIDLSGKTLAQAFDAVQDKLTQLYDKISITVNCDGKNMTVTEKDFSFDSDVSEVLIQAYHYSRNELENPTVPATITDGVANFKITTALNQNSVDTVVKKVAKNFDVQPVNARVTKFHPDATEKFSYADGKNGFLLDHTELKNEITTILAQTSKTGSFNINTKETPFKISLAEIKANTKLIASHRTTANNVYASNENMKLAIRAANGYEIKPGETFSFNEMTGDSTNGYEHHYANGVVGSFVPSTAIVSGQYEQQYGGGICQASTTLYNCAMKADMEAVERHAHQFPSTYAEYGLDATVDYGNLDMKFKNPKNYSVYIATYVYDSDGDGVDELNVEMYGPISADYDEIVTVGWINGAYDSEYSAKGAKVYFKNGKEVKREYLPEGSYDYQYDSYYSAVNQMPSDTKKGPRVEATGKTPTVLSPNGCGSSAPVKYGTAAKVLSDAKKEAANISKPSSTAQTSAPTASSTPSTSSTVTRPQTSSTSATESSEASSESTSSPTSSTVSQTSTEESSKKTEE